MNELTELAKFVTAASVRGTKAKQAQVERYLTSPGRIEAKKHLLNLALSPFITFGIRQIEMPTSFATTDAPEDRFLDLAQRLSSRDLSGNAAKEEVTAVLAQYTEQTAAVLSGVLRKTLECGIGSTLINKTSLAVLKEEIVPVFKVMLAHPLHKVRKPGPWPWAIEYKYDGMRVIAVVTESSVDFYSREGIAQFNIPDSIYNACLAARQRYGRDLVLDGEIISNNSYSQTIHEMKNTDADIDRSSMRYVLFDLIPKTAWDAQNYTLSWTERRAEIESLCVPGDPIEPSECRICHNMDEVSAFYQELIEREVAPAEGIIAKPVTHKYKWGRSNDWMKMKPVHTADLTVVGMYEGKGEFVGTLGGLMLEGELEDGTRVACDVGTGFKRIRVTKYDQPTRDEIWAAQKDYLGVTVEVEYQEVTIAQDSDVHSLRFPVFKGIRIDK